MESRRYEACNDRGVYDLAHCPEGHYFERKSARKDAEEIAKHLMAFANAAGGRLVVGIEDNGTITGFKRDKAHSIESFEHVHVTELVPSPRVEIQRVPVVNDKGDKDYVLVMDVACSENQVVRQRKDGKLALRQGDTSMWLDYKQIRTLEYDKGECYFESEVLTDTSLDDLDPGAVDVYRRAVGTHVSDEKLLHSLGVLKDGHLTKAGMMLFGENVGAYLPQARFRVLKIDGTELGYGDKLRIIKDKTFEGPFVKTIPEARAFISSQLRDYQFQEQETMRFTTMHEYPEYPWFEGLVNAVTHRDYSIYGEYIRVYIYDDRMLIQSPGKLPGAVTLDNIRNHRFSRNPTIARVFSAFDWVRELNEGVDKIFQEMDEAGLPAPEYENDNDYYLKLVLKNNLTQRVPRLRDDRTANVGNHDGNVGNHVGNYDGNVGNHDGNPAANVGNHDGNVGNTKIQLNETEEKVLELVIEDQSLSAQRISEILGVGKRQTERTLKSLREKGLIFREGGTRGFWKILEVPQDQQS